MPCRPPAVASPPTKTCWKRARGFLAVFSDEKADASALTRDFGKEWDIVTYLAIKLVPGAHAFHPSVEAAVNAARQSSVAPDQVARILVAGPQSRTIASRQPPEDMVEAIHSLPYFIASAVADRDFSWIHATPEKIHNPVVAGLIGLIESTRRHRLSITTGAGAER